MIPQLPSSAPFNEAQRWWLNGYLAALLATEDSSEREVAAASAPKQRVLVLYASQSGNSESLAEQFGEAMRGKGFEAPVLGMEDFEAEALQQENYILIVSSTWGEGDPPDNAVDFWEALSAEDFPKLEELHYGVLGLGDSNYLDFCGMGKKFDQRLADLGATRLVPRGDCDTDYEETANAWFESALTALGATQESEKEAGSEQTDGITYSKKHPFPAKLLTNRTLNAADSPRDTRHFEFSLAGSGLSYEVGDVLGIYPKNDPELVDEIVALLGFEPDAPCGESTFKQVLIHDFDIRTVPATLLQKWPTPVEGSFHEVIDLLKAAPVTFESPEAFVSLLRKLGPRLYSISSSPKAHPDEVHLTVAKVTYDFDDRPRKGVCSTYLSDRVNGDGTVRVFLQTAKHFKLPEDPNIPVIMIGPGTGIAPFRAFLEERSVTKAPGKNWLFFGNPHESTDWLYREEVQEWEREGILSQLSTAWSRDQATKVYVQDRMREAGEEFWKWLEEGAAIYVCGDAKRMAKDVDAALRDIIESHGKVSAEEAEVYVSKLKKDKRYQRDVY